MRHIYFVAVTELRSILHHVGFNDTVLVRLGRIRSSGIALARIPHSEQRCNETIIVRLTRGANVGLTWLLLEEIPGNGALLNLPLRVQRRGGGREQSVRIDHCRSPDV